MQIYFTPTRMAKIKKKKKYTLVRMWRNWNPHSLLVGMQNGIATLEESGSFLQKLNILLAYNPEILLLGIPNELKTCVHTKTCTKMFKGTLFVIVKTCKQSRCPSVGKCINKLWYIQTMDCYSLINIIHQHILNILTTVKSEGVLKLI